MLWPFLQKINSSNTWSFALIDYFHDMSLLRNADGDGSINFQKASCTLDGCVKIWTSRVDSVATETGKLLNGLSGDAGKSHYVTASESPLTGTSQLHALRKKVTMMRMAKVLGMQTKMANDGPGRRKPEAMLQLWLTVSARSKSRNLILSLPSTHCSRRRARTSTKEVPLVC